MKHITSFVAVIVLCMTLQAQPILKVGDRFPDMIIRNIINAPVQQLDVNKDQHPILILNFWGTWCSPCIPEMDQLAVLQKNNPGIRVIAISNEESARLHKYLQQKPSKLWLASDTAFNLYRQFGFEYVGQSAVVDTKNKITTLVRTDSINQQMIDRLLNNESIVPSAETAMRKTPEESDIFSADSTVKYQVSFRGYQEGMSTMSRTYKNSIFENRRKTFYNFCASMLFQEAYGIKSSDQVVYEMEEKKACDFSNKAERYCFDIIVPEQDMKLLDKMMQQELDKLLRIKARMSVREMDVYVLRQRTDTAVSWQPSGELTRMSFSGRGFEGTAVTMRSFSDYLANELGLPVVDETGLTARYNIQTENVLRSKQNTLDTIAGLGLRVAKEKRAMDVLVLYEEKK